MIGKHINGRYKLLEAIGDGGMAIVYKAKDLILDRIVAVKLLRPEFSKDSDFIRRFRREAESATSLVHPNIVGIYDVGEEEDYYFIVMEYVPGTTLKDQIRNRGALPIEEALSIMSQITSAIEHAHENNIIHRDIKPHNILINEYGEAKVTDFGIAMAISSATITHTNSVLGSVHYFSPEQARGAIANAKSDIYSLGVVLYEMVTGVLPFSGDSPVSVALKHLQDDFPKPRTINPSIPQSVENIILKAMAKDPLHRYDSAEEMEEAVNNALDPTKVYEEPFSIPEADEEATKILPPVKPAAPDVKNDAKRENKKVKPEKEKTTDTPPPKKKKKGKKVLFFLIVLFLLVGGAAVAALTIIPEMFYVKDVEIPDVTAMDYEEARETLIESNLKVKKEEQFDEEVPEEEVISQDPSGGTTVKENSTVTLLVSKGIEKIEMEDYIGQSKTQVEQLLEAEGYKNVQFEAKYNDEVPNGQIYDQTPEAGKEILPAEDRIIFFYSAGPEPIELQDLTGKTKDEVQSYVDSHGLKASYEEEVYSDNVESGKVVSHSPGANAEVNKGDVISFVISKGKEPEPEPEPEPEAEEKPITFPNSFKFTFEDQEEHLIEVMYRDSKHPEGDEIVEDKVVGAKKVEFEMTINPGDTAAYQIYVDNKLRKENSKTITYEEAKKEFGNKNQ
ncbi:Stk1 family PASTA domain-containing Ser/Thr kinase [Pseudalkalibacillus caeni]|uniref:Serine/threonine-protein kinase PrkC n=1 Tax=Exobacillus caeni TaxID=2574798 RepID=A0A5R9F4J4_9BACL|nr:Stk1 family PASTA domain-containing Ser/Thr kinase [Pseudalkalibacillus caeni]TLS37320.1 Stk1 family PASTA domain-containing Ser/Thr kinase [Pseudalkalibacillus caeni]